MPIDIHLFSPPGNNDDIDWIVDAGRSYLDGKREPMLAHLPLASLYAERVAEQADKAFQGLARVETLNAEMMDLPRMESVLRQAAAAYIPGGNTFLLNHRLHVSRLFPYLRTKLEAGLPLLAFSAGTVLCGPNILTSNDINMVPTTHFDGLKLAPFNFSVHYVDDALRDDRLSDYRAFHDNPVILMEDGAYVRIRGKTTTLVRGEAWIWRSGHEKERLEAGKEIVPYP